MTNYSFVQKLLTQLRIGIKDFPEDFYDSFNYTTTGKNLTHPWTIGLLSNTFWGFNQFTQVGIDVRFNLDHKAKFQPDLVGYTKYEPVLFVDYESPNSSDARIPEKDVKPYLAWMAATKKRGEYIIITTLPDRCCPHWQVRYTSESGCNHGFGNKRKEIQKNPFEFWYRYYRRQLCGSDLGALSFININGRTVEHIPEVGG